MAGSTLDWISAFGRFGRAVLLYVVWSLRRGHIELGDGLPGRLPGVSPAVDACQFRDVPPTPMDARIIWYPGR